MKIEGRNAVIEALNSGTTIDKLYVKQGAFDKVLQKIIDMARNSNVPIKFISNDAIDKMSDTKHHQGVIAFTTEFKYSTVEDILNEKPVPFILILDGIEDPHNLGSIIRVADCMGVSGIIIGKNRCCSVNETVIKVSAGATSYVKIAKVTNINTEIERLKEKNIWVYACELGGDDLTKANLKGAIAIVIGSEGRGVSHLTKKLCDGIVTIPQKGNVNSLNASVATGIVLYETMKQRD